MSFNNIKSKTQTQKGFTIVELLIVVVVIAILAAITIVSYNGITGRANHSASKSAATTLQKKAELYLSEVGNYPISKANLAGDTSKSYYLPGSAFGSTAPSADTAGTKGTSYAQIVPCTASGTTVDATTITGAKVYYWSYGAEGVAVGRTLFATLGACATEVTGSTIYN
jgi:type IV pilus assembly protein PilA